MPRLGLWKVEAISRRRRAHLPLIARPGLRRPVGTLRGAGERKERELPDPHPRIERDRDGVHVAELERDRAVPSGIDEAGGAVDEEAKAAERGLPFDTAHDVVRHTQSLSGRAP